MNNNETMRQITGKETCGVASAEHLSKVPANKKIAHKSISKSLPKIYLANTVFCQLIKSYAK
jgi:hypothetical protein